VSATEAGLRRWRREANLRHLTAARDLLRSHGFAHVEDYVGGDPGWLWHPPWATVQQEAPRVLCLHESDPHAWEGVAVDDTRDTLALVDRVCGRVQAGTLDLAPYETAAVEAWLWWARDAERASRDWADVCSEQPGCGTCPACEASRDMLWLSRWVDVLRAEMRSRAPQEESER